MSNSPYQYAAVCALSSIVFFVVALIIRHFASKLKDPDDMGFVFMYVMLAIGFTCVIAAWVYCSMGITGVK